MTTPMTTVVTVSSAHIGRGERGSAVDCPLALAIREAYPGCNVSVRQNAIFFCDNKESYVCKELPIDIRIQAWLSAYDMGHPVGPISFDLVLRYPIVGPRIKLGGSVSTGTSDNSMSQASPVSPGAHKRRPK
jgi:hypothetical protein